MEWSDDAIVLAMRPHGETSLVAEVLTRDHGRHSGLVRGARGVRAILQPGNTLRAQWRARLSEHLGNFTLELANARAGLLMESRSGLAGLNAFAAVASAAFPERESHAPAYVASEILLEAMTRGGFSSWAPLFVRWEVGVLQELGFGLELWSCAATGTTDDLVYVSPKSGRAVSRPAGEPYRDRLFALPPFLLGSQAGAPSRADIAAGLKLTEFFLLERVFRPHGHTIPPSRLRLDEWASRESD
jgi:DNA repair protein RecO (recombination protein O)